MSYGLRDAEISFNAGTDFGVGIGIPLNTNLSLEIMTGLNYNSIDSMSGTFYDGGGSSDFVSGSGHTWQVPAMCNLLWRFDVTDTFNIGIHGGVGFQYSYLYVHSVYGGAVGPWNYDFWGGNTSFRYQGGLDHLHHPTHSPVRPRVQEHRPFSWSPSSILTGRLPL